jgi:hypothetical protein
MENTKVSIRKQLMISFKLNGVPTLFIKGFTSGDIETMLNFAREANAHNLSANTTILFIDTPITAPTVEAVHKLKAEGFRVVFRDHQALMASQQMTAIARSYGWRKAGSSLETIAQLLSGANISLLYLVSVVSLQMLWR